MGMRRDVKFSESREVRRQREREQIAAMEMLLGATWTGGRYFMHMDSVNYRVRYYDRDGQPLAADKAAEMHTNAKLLRKRRKRDSPIQHIRRVVDRLG